MAKSEPNESQCGQPEADWYNGPWVNILANHVYVRDIRITRVQKKVNVVANMHFNLPERTGIEWMILVAGLYAVNSMLHMESQTSLINNVVATAEDSPVDMGFEFHDTSTQKPIIDPEARILAVLVRDWEAKQCGLL